MGTKINPGEFDCYGNALPDEPMFVLLARDPEFSTLVRQWANQRASDIECGERPISDMSLVMEAHKCATEGAKWRKDNFGKWRK